MKLGYFLNRKKQISRSFGRVIFFPFALLFMLVSQGCGKPVLEVGEFKPYVEKFEQYASAQGKPIKVEDLRIAFGEMDNTKLGVCNQGGLGTPEILINKVKWQELSEVERELLLLHELGHCELKRGHNNDMVNNTWSSIMIQWPQRIAADYPTKKAEYLKELFSK